MKLTIAFLTAASLMSFGCKKKGGGDMMGKMTELKNAMCKCTDKACADKVQADMAKWSADNAKAAGDKPAKPDEKMMAEMTKVGEEYGTCMAKAMSGGESGAAPVVAEEKKPEAPPPAPTIIASCDHGNATCTDHIDETALKETCRPDMDGTLNKTPCPTAALAGSCTLPEKAGIRRYYTTGTPAETVAGAETHCKNAMGGTFQAPAK